MRIRPFVSKESGTTRYFVGCSNYPTCKHSVNLPFVSSVLSSSIRCPRCSTSRSPINLVQIHLKPGNVPPEFIGKSSVVCCLGGCDPSANNLIVEKP
jgi:ssDNA-binding Zn-finger/Zn-ribbon topoisomerase 1